MKLEPYHFIPKAMSAEEWSNMFHKKDKELNERLETISLALEYLKARTEAEEEEEYEEETPITTKPISMKTAAIIAVVLHLLVAGLFLFKPSKSKPIPKKEPPTLHQK